MTNAIMKHSLLSAVSLVFALASTRAQAKPESNDEGTEVVTLHHFPHPLNATMAIPDPVRSYNIRLNVFRQLKDGDSTYDVSGHLSYGMFDWGGIHLRSLGVRTTPFTELIGMVGVWRNDPRTQGISLLGIIGVPTGKKDGQAHHGLSYLAGFTGRIAAQDIVTNDVILHYDFTEKHFIAESGSVLKLWPNLFATLDARGTFGNSQPDISLLSSMKFQLFPATFLALGYHTPVTGAKTFTHQIFAQLEIGSH